MGNQAQVREGATVVRTSTRNFPNRLGRNTNVYLASAELAAFASKLVRLPTVAEYHADMGVIDTDGAKLYCYMNFYQIEGYAEAAKEVMTEGRAISSSGVCAAPPRVSRLQCAHRPGHRPAGDRGRLQRHEPVRAGGWTSLRTQDRQDQLCAVSSAQVFRLARARRQAACSRKAGRCRIRAGL